jgi:hypothetical protein
MYSGSLPFAGKRDRSVNKKLIIGALTGCAALWAIPIQANSQSVQTIFIGRVPETCSIVRLDNTTTNTNNGRFTLIGNQGSITSLCNTASTLSVTVDKAASPIELQNAKIRFTGGNGIYANANSPYQDTATFNSQQTTSAIGDTANIEVDTVAPRANAIVVYASLTAQ